MYVGIDIHKFKYEIFFENLYLSNNKHVRMEKATQFEVVVEVVFPHFHNFNPSISK